MNKAVFNEVVAKHLPTLNQYVPVVARVHGGTHPEFHKVRELFDAIDGKISKSSANNPDLNEDFAKLREITDNYKIPDDVCESYEAVYNMLGELDNAYNA